MAGNVVKCRSGQCSRYIGSLAERLIGSYIFLRKGGKCMVNSVTTKLAELNLEDRFLFDETMENKEAYQAAVSILLEQ